MSNYLESADSESENESEVKSSLTEEQKILAIQESSGFKAEGNRYFGLADYGNALNLYTAGINVLKAANMPKDPLLLLNRSATYLALERYVPALNDANQGLSTTFFFHLILSLKSTFSDGNSYRIRSHELERLLATRNRSHGDDEENISYKTSS